MLKVMKVMKLIIVMNDDNDNNDKDENKERGIIITIIKIIGNHRENYNLNTVIVRTEEKEKLEKKDKRMGRKRK